MSTIQDLIAKARAAQEVYATYSQKQIDKAARACAKIVYDNAELLAKEAVTETGMGSVEGKITKQLNGMRNQWLYTKDKKSKGVIGWEKGKLDVDCILKIAKPAGIVGAIMPSTSPTATIGSNAMQSLKCGNAVIVCPHPRAKNVSLHCVNLIRDALVKVGAPADLVQILDNPSIEGTQELISRVDVIVATGGPGMVKAAYSSGNPSFGVGQGNCQCCIDKGMQNSFEKIAAGTINNRIYDSGIPCTGEQTIIMPEEDKTAILDAFERNGAFIVDSDEDVDKIRKALFVFDKTSSEYILNRDYVGMTVQAFGKKVGIEVPEGKKVLLFKLSRYGKEEVLCKEKLLPVSGYIAYAGDWSQCVSIAKANLSVEGSGHTSVVYTNSQENQVHAGTELPVCRLAINNSNAVAAGGSYYTTGMVPTGGLGCGFWGGNSINENLNYSHLLNITRLIYTIEGKEPPSDEEIWREDD